MQKLEVDLKGSVGLDAVLALAEVSELLYLKKNARYLKQEKYQQLADNITQDGGLTSVPLVALNEEGRYDILSGNHRIKAAAQSGQRHVLVLCIDKVLPHDKRVAVQLAHNALEGKDDPQILKSLYDELASLDLKKYSGVDEEIFAELEKLKTESMSGDPLKFKAVTLMFLPHEIEKVKETFDKIKASVISSESWLMCEKDYDRYLDGMEITKSAFDVKNTALAFTVIMDNFERSFDPEREMLLREEEEGKKKKKTMPIVPLLDTYNIPVETGRKLEKVIQDAISSSTIKKEERYKVLDILIERYWESKEVSK